MFNSKLFTDRGDHYEHSPAAGEHMSQAIQTCVEASGSIHTHGLPVILKFNGIKVMITESMTVKEAAAAYDKALNESIEIYRSTPEYKAQQAAQAAHVESAQEKISQLMVALPLLENKHREVVKWLAAYAEHADISGVYTNPQLVIHALENRGYVRNAEVDNPAVHIDKDVEARYLIGQALDSLYRYRSVHPMFIPHAERFLK